MIKLTHSITSMGVSVFILSFFMEYQLLMIIAILSFILGGINDWLDFAIFRAFEHRNWGTHSLLSPIFFAGLISIIISAVFYWYWILMISIVFCISWILHVFLDSLTFTGVYLFLPNREIKGRIHYKDPLWNIIFMGIGGIFCLAGFLISIFGFK